ncbi:hypothetical protein P3X46_015043 [Hevea brasiliensis]|uniref:DUF4220 domain-containing protein n=1 Tax=Hevea brasiliensis TaxID=3981 RepID=A0ABQ9LUN5_HEVBR|nr:uncharacterized protein LOC110639835 [Hevea brasiliensis]KAJ9171721.1 hypothetical protein P3X46_015043 [Hevea brasiliensis]
MLWQQTSGQQKAKEFYAIFAEPFQVLTITILSILLPLSFLLLARLSCYSYLLSIAADPAQPPSSFLFSLFLNCKPVILYFLVSFVSISTLLHGLTGRITLLSESPGEIYRPRLYTAWILLCTLQLCVGLGIEGSIAAEIDGYSFDNERSLLSRVIFFLGLHETMLYWCRTVVKPVVDDTMFGVAKEERSVQTVAMAVSVGILWWWRLRDEVESLVIAVESRRERLVGIGMADLLGWLLYYLTVAIGIVRVVKGVMWVMLLCRRVRGNSHHNPCGNEDKV